jgi:3-deoxy-manno-octulosonate cytidylyltransferase (CMP-KDO synthetase)
MKITAVIPARYASTRFPGKPLAEIAGKPMLQWVWEGVQGAELVNRTIVATDDARIQRVVAAFGGECIMTRSDHPSGTDRVAEAVADDDADIVVNIQGDEPLIRGEIIDALIRPFESDPSLSMSTASRALTADEDPADPHLVKVVTDASGRALYFSRSPIPHLRDGSPGQAAYRAHIGIYAYRKAFLKQLAAWPPTPLETAEKLEQLRVLERGHHIQVVQVDYAAVGVDRPEDVAKAEALLRDRA